MLLQRALVILNCPHNALKETYRTGEFSSPMFTLSHHHRNSWKRCTVSLSTTMNWGEWLRVDDCGHLLIILNSTYFKSGCYIGEVSNAASNDQDFT